MTDCLHKKTSIYDSRRLNEYWWRKRKCRDCGVTYTTVEVPVKMRASDPGWLAGAKNQTVIDLMGAFKRQYSEGLQTEQIDILIKILEQFKPQKE